MWSGSEPFKGPPADGEVELWYLVLVPERGNGHASPICEQLISIAKNEGVTSIVAHTLPEENASTAVLRRNRFELQRTIEDPKDGWIWAWLHKDAT